MQQRVADSDIEIEAGTFLYLFLDRGSTMFVFVLFVFVLFCIFFFCIALYNVKRAAEAEIELEAAPFICIWDCGVDCDVNCGVYSFASDSSRR